MLKPSAYNCVLEYPTARKVLLFNTLSGAAMIMEAEHFQKSVRPTLESPACGARDSLLQELKAQRMLVPASTDESAILRRRYQLGREDTRTLMLTVLPTLGCNFRCAYCFEPHRPTELDEGCSRKIIDLIAGKAAGIKHLMVTWFGGEPLLAHRRIRAWSQEIISIIRRHQLDYRAGMVTNGYLLEAEAIENLKASWIAALQITLDGPRQVHDARRQLIGGKPTYERIVNNLALNRETLRGMRVSLRINLDKDNEDHVDELLEDLCRRGLQEWCRVYFARVERPTHNCGNCASTIFGCREFSDKVLALNAQLLQRGFSWDGKPGLRKRFCGAGSRNNYVIDANGDIFQCWHDVGNPELAAGRVDAADLEHIPETPYAGISPFDDPECRNCNILPLCMGGCPYYRLQRGPETRRCMELKFNMQRHMGLVYARQLGLKPEDLC